MKRFYKSARAMVDQEGFTVCLDDKAVRTPAGKPLLLPTRVLAEAVAFEWDNQDEKIIPQTMPMMSLGATAIDRVTPDLDEVAQDVARYAGSDMLCYRADSPLELRERQIKGWDPILDWARHRYDVTFDVTTGVMPIAQPEATQARFHQVTASLDNFNLAGVHVMTTVLGSILLALSVYEGRLCAEDAFQLSRLDETCQEELWGVDQEAAVRREHLFSEIRNAKRFLNLLGGNVA
jgi:chaperone required for assembly of F1-ATPase